MSMTRFNLGRRAAILAAAASSLTCSLYLDWDPEGLPCDEEKRCAETYSCLVNRCVEEGSLPETTTCSLPEQCEGYPDVTCGSAPFTCRKVCNKLYSPTGNCEADEYCRPERSRDFDDQWIGTCFPSECHQTSDCRNRVCVPISGTAGACLMNCTYDFDTGSYDDTCGSSLETEQYCQPIGVSGEQALVCLEALGARQGIGLSCDAVNTPCEHGVACVDSVCRKYCITIDDCQEATELCQRVENAGGVPLYSVCIPT